MTSSHTSRTRREPWLKTSTVALLCDVTSETVLAWVKAGKIRAKRTPGGHYRLNPADVDALLSDDTAEAVV